MLTPGADTVLSGNSFQEFIIQMLKKFTLCRKHFSSLGFSLIAFSLTEAASDATELERKRNDVLQIQDIFTQLKI